jgi:hypothetical protein
MSATQKPLTVVVADHDRQPYDTDPIADALVQGDPLAVEQLIAHVLGRAHRVAERLGSPGEARAIFHVAHCFADELTGADPQFDRLRFIRTATDSSS